jgi:hypothetical protein
MNWQLLVAGWIFLGLLAYVLINWDTEDDD